MNSGYALYNGHKVVFTDTLIFNGKVEFLIAWNNEPMWVRASDLSQVVFTVSQVA